MERSLHFVSTGPKFPYTYYIGIMTALRSQDAPVVLWTTEIPEDQRYFELLEGKVDIRKFDKLPEFPALVGKSDHEKRVGIFDYCIWKIMSEYGGVVMGLDSITLGDIVGLLPDDVEMMVARDAKDVPTSYAMHAAICRQGSHIVQQIYSSSQDALFGDPSKFVWGSAGIIPFLKHVRANLQQVEVAIYGILGACNHDGKPFYLLQDTELPHPNARTLPLYASSTSTDQIDEDFVHRGDTLYAKLVQRVLSYAERRPLWARNQFGVLGTRGLSSKPSHGSKSFQDAQKLEQEWWGNCTDTFDEETKQQHYADVMGLKRIKGVGWVSERPIDLGGKSVLDIGGGPVSLLLKCRNRGACAILDPNNWPNWVFNRYRGAGIEYIQAQAEHAVLDKVYDEVWIYNVLQHVESPEAVIATAKKYGRVVRVFEWLGGVPNDAHPHSLTKEFLDKELGVHGKVHDPKWDRYLSTAYVATTGTTAAIEHKTSTFRFHLLGLAHVPTRKEVSPCAYTQKVVKLATMLEALGHTVYFYGGEGSDVACDEFIQVVSNQERIDCYGDYDWRTQFFKHSGTDSCHEAFNKNAIREILARKQDRDFLLCPMGNYDRPIANAVGLMTVESGIGYRGVFSKYRVFESYAWMHYIYGLLRQNDGSWYDCVIPNYFDPGDFTYQGTKDDYFLYIGRLVKRKGLDVAVQVTREIGAKLIIAGQGWLTNKNEGLNITDAHVEHVGSVGPEERKELMGAARAVFVPTYYIEPFGGVAVEAQMCGTPVITTDWGAMSETVLHEKTGFRCRTFDQFVWAAKNIDQIRPIACNEWAVKNYSMNRIQLMYQEYFMQLQDLYKRGWYELHPERTQLDWLRKSYC